MNSTLYERWAGHGFVTCSRAHYLIAQAAGLPVRRWALVE